MAKLESELKTIGRINPSNKKDWQATPAKFEVEKSDRNEVADTIEEYEENSAILRELEIRLNQVKAALSRMEQGKYGIDEIDGGPIEKERLEANPAARTNIKNRNREKDLL